MDYDIPAFDPSSYPWYYAPGLGISLRFSSAQRKLAFAFGAGGRFPIRPHLRNQAAPPEDNAHAVHTHASLRVEHGMAESGPGAGSGTDDEDDDAPPDATTGVFVVDDIDGTNSGRRGRTEGDRARRLPAQLMEVWVFQHFVLQWTMKLIAEANQTFDNVVCYATVRAAIKRYKETGIVDYPPPRPRALMVGAQEEEVLKTIVEEEPYMFLLEIAAEFNERTGLSLSPQHIHGALIAAGLSLKVMQQIRRARDEQQREQYWEYIFNEVEFPWKLIFGDETSMDGRALRRRKGWGPVGSPVHVVDLFHRGKRISVLALYAYDGTVAFRWVEGGYNTDTFMTYIIELIDEIMSPRPGSVLVLDNCRIHKEHQDVIESACQIHGGQLIFLAPYCPHDNPIEKRFNSFKAVWRHDATELLSVMSTEAAILYSKGLSAKAGLAVAPSVRQPPRPSLRKQPLHHAVWVATMNLE